jgi:hypothetical protein
LLTSYLSFIDAPKVEIGNLVEIWSTALGIGLTAGLIITLPPLYLKTMDALPGF